MAWQAAGTVTVGHRMLLHADRVNGRGGRDVRKRHFDRILDRVQQLDDHVGDIAKGQLATLISDRAAHTARLSDGASHLERVKQERLHVDVVVDDVVKARRMQGRRAWKKKRTVACAVKRSRVNTSKVMDPANNSIQDICI